MAEIKKIIDLASLTLYDGKIKTYIGQQIAAASHIKFEKVNALPAIADAKADVIYLVPRSSAGQQSTDICDEYFVIDFGTESARFELIGSTDVDFSQYYTKDEIDAALELKEGVISDLATIRSGAAAGATAVQPAAISDMETKTHAGQTYVAKETGKRLMTDGEGNKLAALDVRKVEASTNEMSVKVTNGVGTASEIAIKEKANTVHDANYVHTDNNYNAAAVAEVAKIASKQDTISDLATIRSGAAAGATAVQPAAISDMETKTHAAATYVAKEDGKGLIASNVADKLSYSEDDNELQINKSVFVNGNIELESADSIMFSDGSLSEYVGGSADTAESNAKSYADGLKADLNKVIEDNEKVTAAALADLDSRIKNVTDEMVFAEESDINALFA